jgi:uncharacterized protein (DUF58 family)
MRLKTLNVRAALKARFARWMAARVRPKEKVTLDRRIIYILPTRSGLMFVFAASLVFVAAINYAVSLAFGLAFLMVSIFILAILHSFNNLNQLKLRGLSSPAVFCGDQAAFKIELSRFTGRNHEALELSFPESHTTHVDLIKNDQEPVEVFIRTTQRGDYKAPLLKITTFFPLGLCRAWSVVDLDLHCIVYPKPVPFSMADLSGGSASEEESALVVSGTEDYYGLRDYVPGDSLRQVAWKNVARGQGMQLKQFVDYVDSQVWLDWDMFYGFSVEEKLSRLCFCAIKLAKAARPFGLKLPGLEIAPSVGPEHRAKLLRALALFGKDGVDRS